MRFSEIVSRSLLARIESMTPIYFSRSSGETLEQQTGVSWWCFAALAVWEHRATYTTSCDSSRSFSDDNRNGDSFRKVATVSQAAG